MLYPAIGLQVALLLFHQVTTLVDIYPFNNVRRYTLSERLMECSVNGVLMVVPIVGFVCHFGWMAVAALIIYPVLLLGEYLAWWRPYFFGPTAAWQKTYDLVFRPTIKVLPPIKNHPVPNLEHTLLHGLTLLTTILTYIAYFTAL
jgi:hypothetical protein